MCLQSKTQSEPFDKDQTQQAKDPVHLILASLVKDDTRTEEEKRKDHQRYIAELVFGH